VRFLQTTLGLRPAPEFEDWLARMGIADPSGRLTESGARNLMGSVVALLE
jgi:ethanolamine ammonia-lyase large subunit